MNNCTAWSYVGAKVYKKCSQVYELQAEVKRLRGLLIVAECPECDGKGTVCDGAISETEYQYHQCRWCFEKKQALERSKT